MQAVTLAFSLAAVLLCTSASAVKTEAQAEATFNPSVFGVFTNVQTPANQDAAAVVAPKSAFNPSVYSADEWTSVPDAAPLRRYSSGSSAASGTTPTPPAPSTQLKQEFTFTNITAAMYTGNVKTLYEQGLAHRYGILDGLVYKTGCSVDSSVTSRRSTKVGFVAIVTPDLAVAAESAATELAATGGAQTYVNSFNAVKALHAVAGNTQFTAIPAPAAAGITAISGPKAVKISNSASSVAASGALAIGLAILALRH